MGRYIDGALEALEAFEQAIRLDPNNADAYCHKGTVLRWLDREDEAIVLYDRAIELAPDAIWLHLNRADCLGELGRNEESLQSFRLVTRLDPNNVDAWANIWDILTSGLIDMDKKAQRLEARQAYERVKELGGHSIIAVAEYEPRTGL
jgi:tetratricopeptide (TPR) repeat protein